MIDSTPLPEVLRLHADELKATFEDLHGGWPTLPEKPTCLQRAVREGSAPDTVTTPQFLEEVRRASILLYSYCKLVVANVLPAFHKGDWIRTSGSEGLKTLETMLRPPVSGDAEILQLFDLAKLQELDSIVAEARTLYAVSVSGDMHGVLLVMPNLVSALQGRDWLGFNSTSVPSTPAPAAAPAESPTQIPVLIPDVLTS